VNSVFEKALRIAIVTAMATWGVGALLQSGSPTSGSAAGCDVSAAVIQVSERESEEYCTCNNIPGRDMVLGLEVENSGNKSCTLYAFIWAANDEVNPPERGMWPTAAIDTCLDDEGNFLVRNYKAGAVLQVPPHERIEISEIVIPQPIGFFDGVQVRFQKLKIELWADPGTCLFSDTVDLDIEKLLSTLPADK